MSKRLAKIKGTFFLYQVTILLSALGLFLGVIANGYINNVKMEIQADQSEVMDFIVNYIKRGQDVPEIAKEFNIYFILDARDGSYITPRQDALEKSGLFWETFRSKLTYLMQKQKNGTVSYPIKEPKEIFKDTKILQYRTLSDLGWIVVAEAELPSEWSLIKKITTKNDLFNLLLGVFVGLVILKFVTDGYFVRLESQITDTHEYSLGNFNQNIIKSSKKKESKPAPQFSKSAFKADEQEMPQKAGIKSKMNFSQKPLGAEFNYKPVSRQESPVEGADEPEEIEEYSESRSQPPEEKIFEPQKIQEVKKDYAPPVKKMDTQVRANGQEFKSPVLNKLLEEFREHKKRG